MIRIAITGPESSGKSTLAEMLSKNLNACLVEEFAREYFSNRIYKLNRPPYKIEDVIFIGQHQYQRNLGQDCDNHIIVCDTEMNVIKVWCEDKFGYCPNEIQLLWNQQHFDYLFLCTPEFPWKSDSLREDENRRELLYSKYLSTLISSTLPYHILKGNQEERLTTALNIINPLLSF
jgi:nicotinamide riboside kinase